MDISSLRKMRTTDFTAITKAFEEVVNPTSNAKGFNDDRYWKLVRDKAGNGSAVIRFLPEINEGDLPWVKIYDHGFQGPSGRWYIENSLRTIGEDDPLGLVNSKLWNSGSDADKETARKQKQRTKYISNVLIISDPANSENNGQVKLFSYGKKIFEMIMDHVRPTFEDEAPVNVFDLWNGANLRLKIRQADGWPSYDKSSWESPSELFDGDEDKLLAVVKKRHDIQELLDRKHFKSFEELSKKLNEVLNVENEFMPNAASLAQSAASFGTPEPKVQSAPAMKSSEAKPAYNQENENSDVLAYFQQLAESA
jgi:gp32 DNA binding protein like